MVGQAHADMALWKREETFGVVKRTLYIRDIAKERLGRPAGARFSQALNYSQEFTFSIIKGKLQVS